MLRFTKCLIGLLAIICLISTPALSQDFLRQGVKELLARFPANQTDLQRGAVASVKLLDDRPEMISLHVSVSETAGTGRKVLTAAVMQEGAIYSREFVPPLKLISGAGEHKIFIKRKDRRGVMPSDQVSVILLDVSGLSIADSRSLRLIKQWGNDQAAVVPEQDHDAESVREEIAEVHETPGVADQELPEIDIHPSPMPNTPEAPENDNPESAITLTDRPMMRAESTIRKPNLQIRQNARLAMVGLTNLADNARWTNGVRDLKFNVEGKKDGTAKILSKAYLADGKLYRNVLFTHCRWAKRGFISGTFKDVRMPDKATRFSATIGFIRGASKGGLFEYAVRLYPLEGNLKPTLIARKRISYRDGVDTIAGRIPKEFQGVKCNVALSVQAVNDSTQGWTVWHNPIIR